MVLWRFGDFLVLLSPLFDFLAEGSFVDKLLFFKDVFLDYLDEDFLVLLTNKRLLVFDLDLIPSFDFLRELFFM